MEDTFQLFLDFYYPELKSLTLTFLTLVSSLLTFSVTFANKITAFDKGFNKKQIPLFGTWFLFFLALILAGFGLWRLFGTAQIAQGWDIPSNTDRLASFNTTFQSVYFSLNMAGVSFVTGMFLLAVSGFLKVTAGGNKDKDVDS